MDETRAPLDAAGNVYQTVTAMEAKSPSQTLRVMVQKMPTTRTPMHPSNRLLTDWP